MKWKHSLPRTSAKKIRSGFIRSDRGVGPIEEKRFVDVEENAVYWYFVVGAWLPIYGVIYWAPRLI